MESLYLLDGGCGTSGDGEARGTAVHNTRMIGEGKADGGKAEECGRGYASKWLDEKIGDQVFRWGEGRVEWCNASVQES